LDFELRECFFWQNDSHRVTDGCDFHFEHGGELRRCYYKCYYAV
jgi:hypothetical protein